MIEESSKWQDVREKLEELRTLVDKNWKDEEWGLAVLGESTIRTVEKSTESAEEMRKQTNILLSTVDRLKPER